MRIRKANKNDSVAIKSLWKNCFHDEDSYIDFFLENKYNPKNTRLLIVNERIIGMIHLLPCQIIGGRKAMYWYAVGIHSNHRGKGYFRYFCGQVLKEMQEAGFTNVCQPADNLSSLYQKMGFNYPYFATDVSFEGSWENDSRVTIEEASPEDFFVLFEKQGSVAWDLSSIRYAISENKYCDGTTIKFQFENKKYVSLAIKTEDGFILDSNNIDINVAKLLKNCICHYLKTNKFILRTTDEIVGCTPKIVGISDDGCMDREAKISFTLF